MTERDFLSLLPATVVEVGCGDDIHRLRWSAGDLGSLDHDDPEGERTLAALGGTSNGCVTVLDAWQRQRTSLRVLTLASRGPADRVEVDPEEWGGFSPRSLRGGVPSSRRPMPAAYRSVMAGGWFSYGPGSGPGASLAAADPDDDVATLFALGPAFADRLAGTVAAHWAERLATGATTDTDRPALLAALTGRVWLAVQTWAGLPMDAVDVRMTAPAEPPAATFHDGRLTVAVPFRWLSRVWAPGLAVMAGRLALDAERDGSSVTLSAVEPDGSPKRTVIRL